MYKVETFYEGRTPAAGYYAAFVNSHPRIVVVSVIVIGKSIVLTYKEE